MISAQQVKELREMTGAGMMDAKNALTDASGDIDDAKEILRKKGLQIADKKAGREANEGLVIVKNYDDHVVIAEINCETDFVAKNEKFQQFVETVADNINDGTETTNEMISTVISEIGENIQLGDRGVVGKVEGVHFATYVHGQVTQNMGRLGVILVYAGVQNEEAAHKVAMHIASINPKAVNADKLDQDWIEKERVFLTNQALESGKPPEIVEKMIEGRMKKVIKDVCLEEQSFVIDPNLTVKQYADKEQISIMTFVRIGVGE